MGNALWVTQKVFFANFICKFVLCAMVMVKKRRGKILCVKGVEDLVTSKGSIPMKNSVSKNQKEKSKKDRKIIASELGTIQIKLTILEIAIKQIQKRSHDRILNIHINKIIFWLDECWKTAGWQTGKRLSSAVYKRADEETALVDKDRAVVIGKVGTIDGWSSWLICLDAFINDVICLWENGKQLCWICLSRVWDSLTRSFLCCCEDQEKAEENGSAIFLKVMDHTKWHEQLTI